MSCKAMGEVAPAEVTATFDDWTVLESVEARNAASNVHSFAKRHFSSDDGTSNFNWDTCLAELNHIPDMVLAGFDQFKVSESTAKSRIDIAQHIITTLQSILRLTLAAKEINSLKQLIVGAFTNFAVAETRGFTSTERRSSGSFFTYRVLCTTPMATDPHRFQSLVVTIDISSDSVERDSWLRKSSEHKYEASVKAARLIVSHGFGVEAPRRSWMKKVSGWASSTTKRKTNRRSATESFATLTATGLPVH